MAVGEWDQRQLCPDGSCIGLIGANGLCKVCGRAAQGWGEERKRGLVAEAADTSDVLDENEDDDDLEDDLTEDDAAGDDDEGDYEEDDEDDEVDPISPSAPATLGALAEWADRRLCPDGSCIGLIGDDGRCKICGKVGSAARAGSAAKGRADDAALEAAASELAASASPEAVSAIAPAPALVDDDVASRKLCPDGGCVGVIGNDGRCKVCGKEAAA